MKSHYHPLTRTIHLAPDASAYARFHELGHKDFHEKWPVLFKVLLFFKWIRFLNYFADLALELDAHFRARAAMMKLGIWNDEACKEGRNNLISYAMRKEIS